MLEVTSPGPHVMVAMKARLNFEADSANGVPASTAVRTRALDVDSFESVLRGYENERGLSAVGLASPPG